MREYRASCRGGIDELSDLKGIPIVKSGDKYRTAAGFTAIKNGINRNRGWSAEPIGRKPDWLRARLPAGEGFAEVRNNVRAHRLNTVCEESMCPNIGECWNSGTATLMVMGRVCTRACRFCAVDTGNPSGWLDPEEPANAARSVRLMGLRYVVLTSVDRDDLPDGGADHYAQCILAIKRLNPQTAVEALTPDFQGDLKAVRTVVETPLGVLFNKQQLLVEKKGATELPPKAFYPHESKVRAAVPLFSAAPK